MAATVFTYNGSGINLDTLTTTTLVVGTPWVATLVPQPTRLAGSWWIFLRGSSAAGPTLDLGVLLALPPAGLSELLVSGAVITNFGPTAHFGGGAAASFTAFVPLNCALVGMSWFAQALVLGDLPIGPGVFDPWLSSAAGGTIGTF